MIDYSGLNRSAVNALKTIYFDCPEWTPCTVSLLPAAWIKHRRALEEIVLAHPRLFPGYKKKQDDGEFDILTNPDHNLGRRTDAWGYVWNNVERGLASYVVGHPLADWGDLATWRPPSPHIDHRNQPTDWDKLAEQYRARRQRGGLPTFSLEHGFMYMRLFYLRGFENLMIDLATDEPRIGPLIDTVAGYNAARVAKALAAGAEYIYGGDDLGLQRSLPVSPPTWRKYLKPAYERIFGQVRDRGLPVYLHTDGHILEIIDDLIDVGIKTINPQIGANGLENLARFKGRVCINLDLDRQQFPFRSPQWIADHIRQAYDALHDPRGGLMLTAECAPDVPLANIEAICQTFDQLRGAAG